MQTTFAKVRAKFEEFPDFETFSKHFDRRIRLESYQNRLPRRPQWLYRTEPGYLLLPPKLRMPDWRYNIGTRRFDRAIERVDPGYRQREREAK